MSNMPSGRLDRILRKRYILAFSMLTLLLIVTQVSIQFALNRSLDDSRIVNIAGRQRMLSQKITKCIYALMLTSQDPTTRNEYLKELDDAIQLSHKSHEGLMNGDPSMQLPGKNSDKINQMLATLKKDHSSLLQTAAMIWKEYRKPIPDNAKINAIVSVLKSTETSYLNGMNAIVFQYDAESKQKVIAIRYMELGLFLVTLFVILLELKLIFLPAEKEIQHAFLLVEDNYRNFQRMFDISPAALLLVDGATLEIVEINHVATSKLLGIDNSEKETISLELLFGANDYNIDLNNKLLDRIRSCDSLHNQEVVLRTPTQENLQVLVSTTRISVSGRDCILIGISDISKQKESERMLQHFASIDGMTGLLNKRSGLLKLEQLFNTAKNTSQNFALCFIDIDGLKHVNDNYGHEEGDSYILSIAKLIQENLRMEDCAFRYGGDELVLLLNNCDEDHAKRIIRRIEIGLDELSQKEQKPYRMSFSTGIAAFYSCNCSSAEEMLRKADEIMYENKNKRKLGYL